MRISAYYLLFSLLLLIFVLRLSLPLIIMSLALVSASFPLGDFLGFLLISDISHLWKLSPLASHIFTISFTETHDFNKLERFNIVSGRSSRLSFIFYPFLFRLFIFNISISTYYLIFAFIISIICRSLERFLIFIYHIIQYTLTLLQSSSTSHQSRLRPLHLAIPFRFQDFGSFSLSLFGNSSSGRFPRLSLARLWRALSPFSLRWHSLALICFILGHHGLRHHVCGALFIAEVPHRGGLVSYCLEPAREARASVRAGRSRFSRQWRIQHSHEISMALSISACISSRTRSRARREFSAWRMALLRNPYWPLLAFGFSVGMEIDELPTHTLTEAAILLMLSGFDLSSLASVSASFLQQFPATSLHTALPINI